MLHKNLMRKGFKLPQCEKHFHDHDETWLILEGRGTGYWIDPAGRREEFVLEAGDVWMIPAGYEHGSDGFPETGKNTDDFTISVFNGTLPEGCHKPGHYYVEREGYLPVLKLVKIPTERYTQRPTLPAMMKGIMFVEQGRAVLQDEPVPVCRPGTVLCQTIYTGLTNGTERNVLCGGNYGGWKWPNRCGYQNVGRVLQVGEGVSGYAPGDVVFSGDFCQHTQYFAAPAGAAALLVKVPEGVDPKEAALWGVAGVAVHDVRRGEVRLGERVLVIGAGPIGLCTAQVARAAGAVVTVCDLNPERLKLAARLAAHATLLPDADWANVKLQGPFDCVFEDSGGPVLDHVIGAGWGQGLIRERGRVVVIAGRERVDYNFNAGQGAEVCVYQAGHFTATDLREVVRLTLEGTLRVAPLIRDVVKYTDAPALYDRLRDAPGSLLGVVFDWQ